MNVISNKMYYCGYFSMQFDLCDMYYNRNENIIFF